MMTTTTVDKIIISFDCLIFQAEYYLTKRKPLVEDSLERFAVGHLSLERRQQKGSSLAK
jgi:hypothetical protein